MSTTTEKKTDAASVASVNNQSPLDFQQIKRAVAAQFAKMVKASGGNLYRVAVGYEEMWATYLGSFPAGSDPIYRERTEHNCSCCRHFIRDVGGVVVVMDDGRVESIWDVGWCSDLHPAYKAVAMAMSRLIHGSEIVNRYFHYEPKAGQDRNIEAIGDASGGNKVTTKTWEHFFVNLPREVVLQKDKVPTKLGELKSSHEVLLRAVNEISSDAVETVLELISQNSLYRGEEHKLAVQGFQAIQNNYRRVTGDAAKSVFIWKHVEMLPAVVRIRNTSIGTLLVDLSEGVDLEQAVRSYESKVAPTNYKRPTALVTKRQIEDAKAKIQELGLASALERRYAVLADVSVNNILFADRAARKVIDPDAFDGLAAKAAGKPKNMDRIEEVTIDRFVTEILPKAESVEVFLENKHQGNLVSLVAPADPTAAKLFKWSNGFSWSYHGDVADSIKERVKRAGGSVVGDLCCRLAWSNYDDLDFHMREPGGGHIFFGDRSSMLGGMLDVDMNAGGPRSREPVENIFYRNRSKMKKGVYTLSVNQYSQRESIDVGFEVEIDALGETFSFAYDKIVRGEIEVAKIEYDGTRFKVIPTLPSVTKSRTLWNLQSNDFHRVNVLMFSPNHWDGQIGIGNRHYFFMLDGCTNDGQARGFYNEFLRSDLDQHRKVLELVGSKMRTAENAEQLSGVGFSSTQKHELLVRVAGSFTRTIKILF